MEAGELQVTARMARLTLGPGEEEKLRAAVDRMLAYCSQLQKADVAGLEPAALLSANRLRADEPLAADLADRILEAAPESEDRFILIPNVL
jgi:aspartyl-tRNA(Asn)/glutamyl-tRNA(Gln) amidotransferase subunit C